MSLTFSDRGASSGRREFRFVTLVCVFILVAGIGIAAGWSFVQGPRLHGITVDVNSLSKRSDSTLTLRLDRAISGVSANQITIRPSAPFEVQHRGLDIELTFLRPLLADTQYEIQVSDLRPSALGRAGNFSAKFETGTFQFLYLTQTSGMVQVREASLDRSPSRVLFEARGIRSAISVASILAVVSESENGRILRLVDPDSGAEEIVNFPPGFELVNLAKASWGTTLILTANLHRENGDIDYDALVLLDVLGDRVPEPVTGFTDEPLSVRSVHVSSTSGEILIWLKSREVLRFNPLTNVLLPIGTASELWGFDSLGEHALYVDSLGTVAQNISTGEIARVPAGKWEGTFVDHQKFLLAPDATRVHRVQVPGISDGNPYDLVTVEKEEGVHEWLAGSIDVPGSIGDIGLSANGQYLLVEFNPLSSEIGFQGLSQAQVRNSTAIQIFDLSKGSKIDEFPGFSFRW